MILFQIFRNRFKFYPLDNRSLIFEKNKKSFNHYEKTIKNMKTIASNAENQVQALNEIQMQKIKFRL